MLLCYYAHVNISLFLFFLRKKYVFTDIHFLQNPGQKYHEQDGSKSHLNALLMVETES